MKNIKKNKTIGLFLTIAASLLLITGCNLPLAQKFQVEADYEAASTCSPVTGATDCTGDVCKPSKPGTDCTADPAIPPQKNGWVEYSIECDVNSPIDTASRGNIRYLFQQTSDWPTKTKSINVKRAQDTCKGWTAVGPTFSCNIYDRIFDYGVDYKMRLSFILKPGDYKASHKLMRLKSDFSAWEEIASPFADSTTDISYRYYYDRADNVYCFGKKSIMKLNEKEERWEHYADYNRSKYENEPIFDRNNIIHFVNDSEGAGPGLYRLDPVSRSIDFLYKIDPVHKSGPLYYDSESGYYYFDLASNLCKFDYRSSLIHIPGPDMTVGSLHYERFDSKGAVINSKYLTYKFKNQTCPLFFIDTFDVAFDSEAIYAKGYKDSNGAFAILRIEHSSNKSEEFSLEGLPKLNFYRDSVTTELVIDGQGRLHLKLFNRSTKKSTYYLYNK